MKKPSSTTGTKALIGKRIGVLLLIMVAIWLIVPVVQRLMTEQRLRSEIASRSAEVEREIASDYAAYKADLRRRSALDNSVYSGVYHTCYQDHNDSGWFATNYNYKCLYNYVDVFEATDDMTIADRQTGAPFQSVSERDVVNSVGSVDDWRDSVGVNQSFWLSSGQDGDELRHELMDGAGLNSVVAYAKRDAVANMELIRQDEHQVINSSKEYIILSWSSRYYSADIGCGFPSIIFCSSPLSEDFRI